MNKVYILMGVVLLIVFIIFCWFFIFHFYEFADTLGDESQNIALGEKGKFIGKWETEFVGDENSLIGFSGIYSFSANETGTIGGYEATWNASDGQLTIIYLEGTMTKTYDYSFSEDYEQLTLTDSYGTLVFSKQSSD